MHSHPLWADHSSLVKNKAGHYMNGALGMSSLILQISMNFYPQNKRIIARLLQIPSLIQSRKASTASSKMMIKLNFTKSNSMSTF